MVIVPVRFMLPDLDFSGTNVVGACVALFGNDCCEIRTFCDWFTTLMLVVAISIVEMFANDYNDDDDVDDDGVPN